MKSLFYILVVFASLNKSNAQEKHLIFWKSNDQLEWQDFTGPVDSSRTVNGGRLSAAATYASIKIYEVDSLQELYCYQFKSVFDPLRSFTRVEDIVLLYHERYHFNLVELYARKLRKKILKMMESDCNIDIEYEFDLMLQEYIDASNKYDLETAHGTNIKQVEWVEMIDMKLTELEMYPSKTVVCTCHEAY